VVKHGIKMTGMPAWEFRMTEAELWATVAFVERLPQLSPQDYAGLPAAAPALAPAPTRLPETIVAADAARGRRALEQYACIACHEIPGLIGPEARLGPPLHGIGARGMLGGVLRNTPENMARWLRDPKAFSPNTAMPALGVSERDARDMAAHLATLK
jgi:cytochrome c2